MRTITKIKLNRQQRRLNDWIMNVLCRPVTLFEKKLKQLFIKRDSRIYNYLLVPDSCFKTHTSKSLVVYK